MNLLQSIVSGFRSVAFPEVCASCGRPSEAGLLVCSYCVDSAFDDPNPLKGLSCDGVTLPDEIVFQDALWRFSKGSGMQDLLHELKYGGLSRAGEEMGRYLGTRLKEHPKVNAWLDAGEEISLLPVPLHSAKQRKRGYNQAWHIAKGVSETHDIGVLPEGTVIRNRFTQTQTGFTMEERLKNLSGAFTVNDITAIENRCLIIVDDVFTTGSTVFELASTSGMEKARAIGVATVAFA